MNRTLKLAMGGLALVIAAGGVYFFKQKQAKVSGTKSSDAVTSVYSYDVKIDSEKVENGESQLVLGLDGTLAIQSFENGTYNSKWTGISRLQTPGGSAESRELLDKPIFSEYGALGFDHSVTANFPEEYAVFAQSVLDHILVGPKREEGAVFKREKNDVSIYNVDYRIAREGGQVHIARKWTQTISGGVRIDPSRNSLVYTFDSDFDLIQMEGQLAFHVTDAQGKTVTVVHNYKVARSKAPVSQWTTDRKSFTRELGIAKVEPVDPNDAQAPGPKDFAEAIAVVEEINQNTLPSDYSKAYLGLVQKLREDPTGLQKMKDKILTLDFNDVEDNSRAAFLYSVLSAHDTKETSEMLSTLFTKDCPSIECKEGAIHSYNFLTNMTHESAASLLEVATAGAPTDRVSSQAWLGVGIAGRNLGDSFPELKPAIERAYSQTDDEGKASERVAILDSIGNLGDRSMLHLLDKAVQSKDDDVRITALAALRFIPGEDVDEALLLALENNEEPHDKGESLRSLALRENNIDALNRIAKGIPTYDEKNRDLAVNSATIILDSFERNPELTKPLVEDLSQNLKDEEIRALFTEALNPNPSGDDTPPEEDDE